MPQFIIGTGLIGIHCRMPGRRGGSQFIYQKRGASGDAADLVMDFPILYLGELRRESKIREGGNNAANKALPGTLDLSRGGGGLKVAGIFVLQLRESFRSITLKFYENCIFVRGFGTQE